MHSIDSLQLSLWFLCHRWTLKRQLFISELFYDHVLIAITRRTKVVRVQHWPNLIENDHTILGSLQLVALKHTVMLTHHAMAYAGISKTLRSVQLRWFEVLHFWQVLLERVQKSNWTFSCEYALLKIAQEWTRVKRTPEIVSESILAVLISCLECRAEVEVIYD